MKNLQRILAICMVASSLVLAMLPQHSGQAQESGQIVLNYSFKIPKFESGFQEPYELVTISGLGSYGLPGNPVMPLKTAKILIAYGEEVEDIQVIPGEKSYLGKFYIQPGQKAIPIGDPGEGPTPPDPLIYNSTKPYPKKLFSKVGTQWKRGYQILVLNLYPVEYVPKSMDVSYFNNFEVVIKTKAAEAEGESLFRDSSQDREELSAMVDNPREVDTYTNAETLRQSSPLFRPVSCVVYATREGLVGSTTANGHVIQEHDHFVALPSTKALCSKEGHEYEVRITYKGESVIAPVWDVGHWNTKDDYWNPSSEREMWKDLPQGKPEAQVAYQDGYNGGKDQFGRMVTNPAGIDLADGTFWDDLEMTDNDWVTVEFLWTTQQCDYVIITNEELKNAAEPNFQTLADWKKSRGVKTTIVTVEDMYANYPGVDNQEKIRNFIRDAYLNNGVEYVLLGGDADGADVGGESGDNIVPVRGLWAWSNETDPPNIPSDLYYACLDGNYDYDGDGIYGEPNDGPGGGEVDLMAEVYVGRAPVDSAEELSNFVSKTISYEQSVDDPYLKEVWMVGELLWEEGGCAIEEAVKRADASDSEGILSSLRKFRDEALSEEYVRFYYEYSPDVTRILIQEPRLSIELARLIVKYMPAMSYIVGDPNGKDVKVTQADIDQAISFVEKLKGEISKRQEKIGAARAAQIVEFLEEFEREASVSESKNFSEAFKSSVYSGMGGNARLTGETWGGDYKDEIKDGSSNYGYRTEGFPDAFNSHTLYDRDYSGHDWPKSEIMNIINSDVHIINHLGHASVDYVMKMNNDDVDALTNNKYFLGYSQGCYAGSFDNRDAPYPYGWGDYLSYDCVAEHLVTNPTGAFAFVANSRFGWGEKGSTNGASQYYDRQFWNAVFREHVTNLGKANQDSKEANIGYISSGVMRFCYYEINLLGDPETPLFDLRAQYEHDIAVTDMNMPWKTKPGASIVVQATVRNIGKSNESNVEVQLLEDDIVRDATTIETLPSGASQAVHFIWSSAIEGACKLKVYAVPVAGEGYTDNNYEEGIIKVGRAILVDDDGKQCPEFDFISIQQAINAASDGDVIKVYPGIYGKVIANKGVRLVGINLPVIDGNGTGNVVEIQADNAELQGFKIINSGQDNNAGIWIQCSHSQIRSNDVTWNQCGIALNAASNNNISNNTVSEGKCGVFIESSCSNNDILSNSISSNDYGIYGYSSSSTALSVVLPNRVFHNNLVANSQNAYDDTGSNEWYENYWSDYTGVDANGDGIGDTPYEIPGDAGATDDYPLVEPYLPNNPPNTPSNPSPANHASSGSINVDLSWTGGDPDAGDTVTYDVYFDTTNAITLVSNDQTATTYDLGVLDYNTKYYWKVVASDNHGATTEGPVWDFTTGPLANNPPQLSSGNVEPSSGHPSTDFYYYVNYYDSDGDSPTVKYVRIDGTAYPMSLYSGSASNGVYRYGPKNLAVGSHNYYFYFGDGKGGTTRLPISGSYYGPSVSWGEFDPDFEANPREGNAPLEVEFDPTWTTDGALPYVKAEWDFNGDGIIDQTKSGGNTMDTVTYTYYSVGIYTVSLTITDSCTPEPLVCIEVKIDYITVIGEAASVSIDPPSRTVSPGSSCNIDVWVDAGDNNLKGIDVAVEYDADAMTTTEGDVVAHNLLGEMSMGPEVTEAAGVGEVTYQVASVDAVAGVDASVMTITFTMDAAAEPGDYALTITKGDLADENAEPVVVLINDGTVTVVIGRKGDFDGDGDIDIFDFVLFAAAYGSELGDDNYNAIGDFDNNDCIDIYDFVLFAEVYGT